MCGICGKIDFHSHNIDEALIHRMAKALSHRGPDDAGVYVEHSGGSPTPYSLGLGHKRLSIIDLSSAGHQPMTNEDHSIWMVFNGEIYNGPQLRSELVAKGHKFSSATDCEPILHLYEEEGIECLKKLNGMFSFALWDKKTQNLFLCRDPIGIKPLVYFWNGRTLSFASEIKALFEDPDVTKSLNFDALNLYLSFNCIAAPYTIFDDIYKLEPGHYLSLRHGKLEVNRYWDLSSVPKVNQSVNDIAGYRQKLYSLLEDAVRLQLISDVSLGAFLSGGVDSSIIVGLMSKVSKSPVETFSIGYEDMPLFDETHFAREVAQFHHTNHHEIKLKSKDILNVVNELLNSFDEPFADSSAIPTFIVSRETRRHVKVALSGDGGDELFAGYRMYAGEHWYKKYKRLPSFLRKNMIEPLISALPDSRNNRSLEQIRRVKKFLYGAKDTLSERFLSWNEIFRMDVRKELIRSQYANLNLGQALLEKNLYRFETDTMNQMLYADLSFSLPSDMLTKVDLMSMRNSLEVRVPFLDPRVVDLAFQMPGHWKMDKGQGKKILLETFRDLLPTSIFKRSKWGFEVPISQWLKTDLKFLIDEHLNEEQIKREGIFNDKIIKRLIDEHLSGKKDHGWQLWNLICFEAWYKKFIR
jgi:asparagine synthase (glutamine-hydrolysing)